MKKPLGDVAKASGDVAKAALNTPIKRWTWGGAAAAFAPPAIGLAVAGTAVAVWWAILLSPFAILGAMVGHLLSMSAANRTVLPMLTPMLVSL